MAGYTSGSLRGGDLEIGIALVLQDRFSNQAREASSTIRQLHRDAKMAANANLQAAGTIAANINGIASSVLSGIGRAITEGASFIDTMTTVKAITGATDKQFKELGNTAQGLGLKTMFDSQDIASGMKYLAMAGNSVEQIQDMIHGAAYVAGATGMELGGKGGAADVITNVMRTFSIEGKNASQVVGDQLAKAALSSNVSMTDLAETIKYAGADMVTLGQTLPQVAAMAGTLGNAGIQASMAGTAISNMARYLNKSIASPNFKGAKMLASIGLGKEDFLDVNGEIIDMGTALGKIKDRIKDMNASDRNNVMNQIFGVRGMRAGVAMMNHLEDYQKLLYDIAHVPAGYAEDVMGQRMDNLAGSLDKLYNSIENIRTTFAEAIGPVLKPILNGLAQFLEWVRQVLDIPILGTIVATLTGLVAVVGWLGSRAVMAAAGFKLLFGDSQVSIKNMFRLLTAGWTKATILAKQYMGMERAIIAQRKGGFIGEPFNSMLGRAGFPTHNVKGTNIPAKQRSDGRWIANTGKGATGWTLVGKETVQRASKGGFLKSLLGGAAGSVAAGAAKKGIGRAILGVGARLVGVLSGPLGWAVTGLSIAIPLITSAVKKSRDATAQNTQAINGMRSDLAKEAANNTQLHVNEQIRVLYQAIRYFGDQIPKIKPQMDLTVNIDGKKMMQQVIQDQASDINLSLGTK